VLFRAVYWGLVETFKYLVLNKKVDLEISNITFGCKMNALAACVHKNRLDMAKLLLYYGADPFSAEEIMQHDFYKSSYMPGVGGFYELIGFYKRWQQKKKSF